MFEKVTMLPLVVYSLLPSTSLGQFVPGFLVESGTDLQEYPKNLSHLFPDETSPEEQQDYYGNAVAQIYNYNQGQVAADLPDHNPVDEILPKLDDGVHRAPEEPGLEVLPNGTARVPETQVVHQVCSDADPCRMVAFSVARAHYKHRKAGLGGVQVLFDKVLSSVGPGYNHSGGYFKVECPGYYHFSVHGLSPLQGRARLDLMRNRQRITSAEAQYYGFGTAANSVIIYAYKGDIIYVYLASGHLYENDARYRGYATFTGFKVA